MIGYYSGNPFTTEELTTHFGILAAGVSLADDSLRGDVRAKISGSVQSPVPDYQIKPSSRTTGYQSYDGSVMKISLKENFQRLVRHFNTLAELSETQEPNLKEKERYRVTIDTVFFLALNVLRYNKKKTRMRQEFILRK